MQLVEIKKLDLVTNTAAIAEGVGRDHDTIIKLVDRNKSDLEEFGEVGFEIRAGYNNAKVRVAVLNEQQTTLLITYMRNNEVVRAFKKRLVAEFFTMRSALAKKKMDRNSARLEYKPMTDAIKHEREAQGKQIAPHHFSNEADLINRLALGMTSAKFRVHHEIGKKEPIRDYLTPEQIHCITELQRANTVFISMGWDFEQRKEVLRGMFERNHRQPLIEEQHRLAA
ncbi:MULTISPECIES: Rha family transcriptional regulator [Citrobacter]|uniref:Rha family transcriptional regulator n=1 Tax=Citrobacter TaxID=544 RepID=UPI002574DDAF|nr:MULTISPECIES: Rha family transcriptional regulator [Citrobacter]MDM3133973.1 Rha family transcriptional regulator [Citrobacter sp. Cf123]MDM3134303.1 Rha family transcriptional regulator [Citrobacter sp. Cf123]MDM3134346.1 Rha family transcriptional regulator [Citrobacter sp. Cf123]MDM3135092.1 Rha family transcriptional regulator [Citrobacter sp. Cf123]MDS0962864.1 Rha family transcriptional regulator [Citrobacter freundii]